MLHVHVTCACCISRGSFWWHTVKCSGRLKSHWRLHETSCTENEKCACAQRNCIHPEQLVAYMCVYRLRQLTNEVNNSETATDCVHDVACQLENVYMSHMFLSKLYCSILYLLISFTWVSFTWVILPNMCHWMSTLCLSGVRCKLRRGNQGL